MNDLPRFVSDPHTCAYLPDRDTTLEYSCDPALSAEAYEALMNRGYRKFGLMIFRPVCAACTECRPIRLDAAAFKPNRSQRRAIHKNRDLEVRVGRAVVDAAHLDLYRRYHEMQHSRKNWEFQDSGEEEYAASFLHNPLPNFELSLWEKSRLCAVALADVTPNTVSAIYHYHEPAMLQRSLGTCALLHLINIARQLQKRWVYLGFYVKGCGSMKYKAAFQPCEIMDEKGIWRPFNANE
jgi:arginine-tRNA-protein transferase